MVERAEGAIMAQGPQAGMVKVRMMPTYFAVIFATCAYFPWVPRGYSVRCRSAKRGQRV